MSFLKPLLLAIALLFFFSTSQAPSVKGNEERLARLLAPFEKSPPKSVKGETLYLFGQVLDTLGHPLPGSRVEIWQTDIRGKYRHPKDSKPEEQEKNFQYFGTSPTDSEGWYTFRTILPAAYPPRPRHIHFKVKRGHQTLLTSQFYFSEDIAQVKQEQMFQAIGTEGEQLLLQLQDYRGKKVAQGDIYIGRKGTYRPTPFQPEGPFYPVDDVKTYDRDLLD